MTMMYACISTHHLFDHKPDNYLARATKHQLSGFYKFGTPGIAVVWGDKNCIDGFMDTLKRTMPQKKFEFVFLRQWKGSSDGKTPQGWNEVQPPTLKDELTQLGVPDEDYYSILGLNMKDGGDHGSGGSNTNEKSSKTNKGKGKKK